VLALVERAVGDPLEQLRVLAKGADVSPGDLVGAVAEVVVAQYLEPSKHRVDLGLLRKTACASLDLAFSF
jgi:hypothetical protein